MESPFFTVLPGHDLVYNEIVKPSRRWAFSYYYLYRWLPLLHPQQAMLIQVLRQSTWQNGRPTGRCQLTNAALCRQMGWSESSHKTLLNEMERPLSDWFITRERTRKRHVSEGHAVEGAPRYRVKMDDPLTPADQLALRALLANDHPSTPYEAAERLDRYARRRTRELWAVLDEQESSTSSPSHPTSVEKIAASTWSHLDAQALASSKPFRECAERLQLKLTGAGYAHMELDYLMRAWLPTLGINHTILVIALRARCFHDPGTGEVRDVVTLGRKVLERQLGIPGRTFRRLLRSNKTIDLFHITPENTPPDPTNPRQIPHRGDLSFHVAYPLLPIAPLDRQRYETLLLNRHSDTKGKTFSTTGQPTRLEPAMQPGCSGKVFHDPASDPAQTGQPTQLQFDVLATQPGSKRPTNPTEPRGSGHATRLEPANQPDIQQAEQYKDLNYKNQERPPNTLGKGGETTEPTERESILHLLEPFQIKGLSRILQNNGLTADEVRGWILRGKQEVESSQMGGYLFRRLSDGREQRGWEPLPARYRLAGQVEEAEEVLFERWWLQEMAPPPFSDEAQRERYGAWLSVVKGETGDPDRPDFSPRACWRREMARARTAF